MSSSQSERSTIKSRITAAIALVSKDDWLVIGWVLATKLLIFVFGIKSFQVFENQRFQQTHDWLELFNRWDAPHYLKVAQAGYTAKDVLVYPFFPLCRSEEH